ncbi:hypothetical protein EON65_47095 [archaeon]|nr:MAG: hypothetical protein EON65_47095 [archaeon]
MKSFLLVLFLLGLVSYSNAAYVVGYYQGSSENQNIVNDGASFATLTSVHVADLYSRVSGLPPLTWQGE